MKRLLVLSLLSACSSADYGFAVELTIRCDSTIDDATLARVTSVQLDVGGDEPYHHVYPLQGRFLQRVERWVYEPQRATRLQFAVTPLDSAGAVLGFGQTPFVDLRQNATVSAEVIVSASAPIDLGAGDLASPNDGGNDGGDSGASDLSAPCLALPSNATDFYVDGNFAGGTGTAACPLLTISAALAMAGSSSAAQKTIHVAAGTYSTGETFPLMMRNGISLVGAGLASTIISGSGNWSGDPGTPFAGSVFATLITGSDSGATNLLKGVTVKPGVGVPTSYYEGVICDRGNAVEATVATPPPANLVIDRCQLGPNYEKGVEVAISSSPVASGCNLQMIASIVTGNFFGVFSGGCPSPVNVQLGDGTTANANTFTNLVNDVHSGSGLLTGDCSRHIRVRKNTFQDSDGAVVIAMNATVASVISFRDNLFTGLSYFGLLNGGPVQIGEIIGNTFTGIGGGVGFPSYPLHHCGLCLTGMGGVEQALNNNFTANEVGVEVIGGGIINPVTGFRHVDFGHSGESGNNIFSCNSNSGASPGHDFWVHDLTGPSDSWIWLLGNIWDHAVPTSDASDGSDLPSPPPSPAPPVLETGNNQPPASSCPAGKSP